VPSQKLEVIVPGRLGAFVVTVALAPIRMNDLPVIVLSESPETSSDNCIINPPYCEALAALGFDREQPAIFVSCCESWEHYEAYHFVPDDWCPDGEKSTFMAYIWDPRVHRNYCDYIGSVDKAFTSSYLFAETLPHLSLEPPSHAGPTHAI
jgi:hypothetical protein